MSFLEEVVESTKQAVEGRRRVRSLRDIRAAVPARADDRRFLRALQEPGMSLIAEFKRSSPSHPVLALKARVETYVDAYERGRASALSILTEERYFSGSLEDLCEARQRTSLPLLRKDFVIDEYQLYEAAVAGADAVLLIAAVLDDDAKLRGLYDLARELRLDVLVEIRNEDELATALGLKADLIGVNNRDLKTPPSSPHSFEVDVGRTARLYQAMPGNITVVAESGLQSRHELDDLESLGVQAALVGSALMEADDPAAKCLELTQSAPVAVTDHPAFA